MTTKKILAMASVAIFLFACGGKPVENNDTKEKKDSVIKTEVKKESETVKMPSEKFVSKEGKFKALFPEEPKHNSEKIDLGTFGKTDLHSFMFETATFVYLISYSDYPSKAIKAGTPKTMLQNCKNGFVENLKLNVESESEEKINNNPGISFKAKSADYYVIMKDYLVGNRLYQVGIMRSDRYANTEEINAFFGSFELTK